MDDFANRDADTTVTNAFSRLQAELRLTAGKLSKQFLRKFNASHLQTDAAVWVLDMDRAPGPWTGTAFRFNERTGTVVTHPSANFSSIPGDQHVFVVDPTSGRFTENGQTLTDAEAVRLAIDMFLRSALGIA
jgi:hypothetical protein